MEVKTSCLMGGKCRLQRGRGPRWTGSSDGNSQASGLRAGEMTRCMQWTPLMSWKTGSTFR
jgi:hypothetical protein